MGAGARTLETRSSVTATGSPAIEGFDTTPAGGLEVNINSERLQGKRILVTALDLEQREHRGIAVYSKALIRHLRRMGAEVWLLTQFKPIISDLNQLPKETQRIIYSSRTLDELVHGRSFQISKLEQFLPFLTKFGNRYRRIRRGLKILKHHSKHHFNQKNEQAFILANSATTPICVLID